MFNQSTRPVQPFATPAYREASGSSRLTALLFAVCVSTALLSGLVGLFDMNPSASTQWAGRSGSTQTSQSARGLGRSHDVPAVAAVVASETPASF